MTSSEGKRTAGLDSDDDESVESSKKIKIESDEMEISHQNGHVDDDNDSANDDDPDRKHKKKKKKEKHKKKKDKHKEKKKKHDKKGEKVKKKKKDKHKEKDKSEKKKKKKDKKKRDKDKRRTGFESDEEYADDDDTNDSMIKDEPVIKEEVVEKEPYIPEPEEEDPPTPEEKDDDDFEVERVKSKPKRAKVTKKVTKAQSKKVKKESKPVASKSTPTKGGRKKKEDEQAVWKWWEELDENSMDMSNDKGADKWKTLSHKGPVFAPDYVPVPSHVHFRYDGKPMKLSTNTEEVASFYAKMLNHDYVEKKKFNDNFFHDWRQIMSKEERSKITDLSKCDFKAMHEYFAEQSEIRKNRTKEEKNEEKVKNAKITEEFGVCVMDGFEQKIGNFRIEPPGLFRGRGEHPKMGKLKRRVNPSDVIINCGKNDPAPKPPSGHRWKEVRHDNKVSWLATWTENIMNSNKYIMLNPSSKLKGQKDWQKYEKARSLHLEVDRIRESYRADFKVREMKKRQRAVALYFIDKLALRAGNEKDEGESADTVGCCSLRVEHIKLRQEGGDDDEKTRYIVDFDFLGKDSIRYQNSVDVEKRVFRNLELFMKDKKEGDSLFDRMNTTTLNEYLTSLMPGLTAKVFRTYNASITLHQQLEKLCQEEDAENVANMMLAYNRANRAVAVLCNHQRAAPKTFEKSMENLNAKIQARKDKIKQTEKALKSKKGKEKDSLKKTLAREKAMLHKLEVQALDREENKTIALGTSKLNYLDPRISIAWCKKHGVPIEKVYNKTQRQKFQWAIDMTESDFDWSNVRNRDSPKKGSKSIKKEEEEDEDSEDGYE